jgi:hypothetical protein
MLTLLMFETASKAHEKYSEVISSIRGHSHQKYGSISPGKKKRVGHIPTEKRGYNSMLIYPFITTTSHYEPLTNHDIHQLL